MKKLLSLIVLLIFVLGVTGCASKGITVAEIQSRGKLVVATNAEFPPFEYLDGTQIVGFDIEIAKAIAEALGVTLEIKNMDFDSVIASVQSGAADIAIAGLTVSQERLQSVSFSSSYFDASQVVIVRSDNITITGTTIEQLTTSLEGKRIGVQVGTVAQFFVAGDEGWGFDGIANATLLTYTSGILATEALKNGQIDAVIIDEMPANAFVANNTGAAIKIVGVPLTVEEYAIAIPKNSDDLVAFINQVLADMKLDGRFEAITLQFFGTGQTN
jgi:ABC-type amino acid transport substrate-binding protein